MPNFVKATPKDKEAVYSLFKACQAKLEKQGNFMWSKGYPEQSYFNNDIDEGRMFLVVEDGKIIASIGFNLDPLDYFYPDSHNLEAYHALLKKAGLPIDAKIIIPERLMVHPEYQGRGIATSLFAYLHENFKDHSWLFSVFLSDLNALRLYRHLGFSEVGVIPSFEWGGAQEECTLFSKKY